MAFEMNRLEEFRAAARGFACPTCAAEPGEKCFNAKGERRVSNHQSRADLARETPRQPRPSARKFEIVGDATAEGFVVYAIRAKETGRFGYVGQTGNFASRTKSHLKAAYRGSRSKRLWRWMHEVVTLGGTLEFVLLARCDSEEHSLASEAEWVGKLTKDGHDLTNKWLVHQDIIRRAKEARGARAPED